MKPAARISAGLARALQALEPALAAATLDAAAEALAAALEQARTREGLGAPLIRSRETGRRVVAARDAASVARELGMLADPPAPWLAPVLPAARSRMRAAALARVRDVVAAHAGKRKRVAVARALSRRRTR